MDKLYQYIDDHTERGLLLLEKLVAQPSVSAQNLGLPEMAELTAQAMRDYGLDDVQVLPTKGGPPAVYGEKKGASDKTLLFYNHYDVQPAEPLELWESPPFEPVRRDGKLFGRGCMDNKGDIASRLEMIAAWSEVYGEPPVNIKFIIEGEEESGSPYFMQFVRDHRDLLQADDCLLEGGGTNAQGDPILSAGVKGLLNLELTVCTAATDAHSANAAVVPNAAWRLLWALSTIKRPDERIQIEGFYDDVRPWNESELAALKAIQPADEEMRQALGVKAFLFDLTGEAWQERLYQANTCNICGFDAGYTGPGPKTVIPAKAMAKVDFRLVPDQKPLDILAKLERHLEKHGFGDVQIEILGAEGPARTAVDDPFIRMAVGVTEEFYGRKALLYPTSAGTAPVDAIVYELGIPSLFAAGGVGHADSNIHAPNENIYLADLAVASKYHALFLKRYAELG